MTSPTVVLVSVAPGSGKTTLAAGVCPVLEVDTTDGYEPGLDAVVAWVRG